MMAMVSIDVCNKYVYVLTGTDSPIIPDGGVRGRAKYIHLIADHRFGFRV